MLNALLTPVFNLFGAIVGILMGTVGVALALLFWPVARFYLSFALAVGILFSYQRIASGYWLAPNQYAALSVATCVIHGGWLFFRCRENLLLLCGTLALSLLFPYLAFVSAVAPGDFLLGTALSSQTLFWLLFASVPWALPIGEWIANSFTGERCGAKLKQAAVAANPHKEKPISDKPSQAESCPEEPFEHIVGQDHVISELEEIAELARRRVRFHEQPGPLAVVLLLGPTGVGKTEAARCLAAAIYGSRSALIRFDMGQFTNDSQVQRFYGSAPGYVDSEKGGQLINEVNKRPDSVVLLDEVEKAHVQIWDAFLPVFDEGFITEASTNARCDMRNTTIVLTSNLLSDRQDLHGLTVSDIRRHVEATGSFRTELLGRIQEILVFKTLSDDSIREIIRRRVAATADILERQGVAVSYDDTTIETLFARIQGARYGVREINENVERLFRKQILEREDASKG